MYIETRHYGKGNKHVQHLLRESIREGKKVSKRTILNITDWPPARLHVLRNALKTQGEDALATFIAKADVHTEQGLSVGALLLLQPLAKRIGIVSALGNDRQGTLALWQVLARIIDQGSRLSAVRLAKEHAVSSVLGLPSFDEDALYENLDWLSGHQQEIEDRLFAFRGKGACSLVLYDVTSTYLEGVENDLAEYGYNRDKKKGKLQIVAGLLCDEEGFPLSVQLFAGNTSDTKTVSEQIKKAQERFGAKDVIFVGDRGMLKGPQRAELLEHGFRYITALGKPEVETLLKKNIIQMSMFEEELCEVLHDDRRFILRRNPVRQEEIQAGRADKRAAVEKCIAVQHAYLSAHPLAKGETGMKKVQAKLTRLKCSWLTASLHGRTIVLTEDAEVLKDLSALDGCYVLMTDVSATQMDRGTIHARYKDLAKVERAFRTAKSCFLEIRPVYVRKESRTRGHALVVMLAYALVRELSRMWQSTDMTVEEGIHALSSLCLTHVRVGKDSSFDEVPLPRPSVQKLFSLASVSLSTAIPTHNVATDPSR